MSEGAERVPRGQGRAPPAGPSGAAVAGRPWPVGGPQVALWFPGAFRRIRILRKFSAQFDGISCGGLSEIEKQQKQETGNRHLVNRLVRQNA